MSKLSWTVLLCLLLLAGCRPVTGPLVAPAVSRAGVLTAAALQNAVYSGIYDAPITLTDGRYEGEPFVVGDAARPTVDFVAGVERYGDLDGDGVDDAVVFLVKSGGGTGAFVYVAAQRNRDGQPVDAGAVRIEDRIQVRSATVQDGQVLLDLIVPGPGDGACCPSYKVSKRYALQDGLLAELPGQEEELVKVTAAALDGTSWTLVELGDGQPALAEPAVTVSFQDGQISGSGGCNDYTGSFTLGEENPFVMTVGPVAATAMACPDPVQSQEDAYFTALSQVSQWGYWFGRLALYHADGQGGLGRLLFAPAGGVE
jgi:heat shock protein HslJ